MEARAVNPREDSVMRERDIFINALEQNDAAQRAAVLDDACQGDAALRSQVERLLAEHELQESFILDTPPAGVDATVDHRPLSERPGTVIGPYKLLQQIGEGGMGVVFMAEQTEPLQRTVALKIIKPGMDTRQVIARFEAERQALALMDHPNIAKVLDAGTTDSGRPYFVMELVKGVPITQYCDEKHLPLRTRLELLVPVCQAVQHAHQKGLIHRDIKPSNVLVAEYDDHAVPKVIDFGVAKATAQKLTDRTMFTEFGQVVGTVEYMSPEQAKLNQLDVDTRSDIYSLGVLLYELLTGSTPFGRKRLQEAAFDEMLRIIREEEPPKPSTRLSTSEGLPSIAANRGSEPLKLNRLVRGELDWVVMKALEKDRNRRYETANGLAADIQRYLDDEAVQACPASATYRFGKFARRNRGALLAGAAILATLVLLVVGLAVSNLLIAGERNQKAAALIEKEEALGAAKVSEAAAQAESKRAEEGFLRASIAIREVLTKAAMGSGEWSQLPPPLRKQFGHEAVRFYEELLDENSDPNLQYQAAVGFRAIGTLHTSYAEPQLAEASFRRSIEILERIAAEHPLVPQYRHQLAWSLLNLGRTVRTMKRTDEAQTIVRKAAELYETLLSQTPNSFDFRNELATCYVELSQCHADSRDFKLAADAILQGIAMLENAIPRQSEELLLKERLAGLHFSLGTTQSAEHRYQEAKASFQTAAELCEDAASNSPTASLLFKWGECYGCLIAFPSEVVPLNEAERFYREFLEMCLSIPDNLKVHPNLRENIGHTHRFWAYKLLGAGRREEAEQVLSEALVVFEKLMTDVPDRGSNWHFAADTERQIADSMFSRGKYEQAEQGLQRSIELHEQRVAKFPDLVVSDAERAASYKELAWLLATSPVSEQRNAARAVELAQKAVEIQPTEGGPWNTLGVAQYRAAQWQPAVDSLTKSIDLREGGDAVHWFFLAMAHWQLDHDEEARKWYDKAAEWMAKNRSQNKPLNRFHAEADTLMKNKSTAPDKK